MENVITKNKISYMFKESDLNLLENIGLLFIVVLSGLAIGHSDTTLAPEWVSLILFRILKWFVVLVVFFIELRRALHHDLHLAWCALMPLPYCAMIFINSYVPDERFHVLGLLILMIFLNRSAGDKIWLYEKYRKWLVFMSAVGVVCYLSYILRLGLSYENVAYYGTHDTSSIYANFKLCYVYVTGNYWARLCGLFNEPGYFGTIVALVLIIDGLNFRRIGNLVMFIAGCCTFSLAFVVLMIMGFVLQNMKRIKLFVPIVLLGLGLINLLPIMSFENPQLQHLVDRLQIVDGRLAGDNRSGGGMDDKFLEVLRTDPFFGRGKGYNASIDYGVGVLSIKREIIDLGIIGFAIMYGMPLLVLYLYRKVNLVTLPYILCFFASQYQRPYMYQILYIMLLFAGVEYILRRRNEKN